MFIYFYYYFDLEDEQPKAPSKFEDEKLEERFDKKYPSQTQEELAKTR